MNIFNLFTKPTPKRQKWGFKIGEEVGHKSGAYKVISRIKKLGSEFYEIDNGKRIWVEGRAIVKRHPKINYYIYGKKQGYFYL